MLMCPMNAGGATASGDARGGEISSANYVARGYGVRAGMFVRSAKRLCGHLVVLPYDFDKIKFVSETAYKLFCQVRCPASRRAQPRTQ